VNDYSTVINYSGLKEMMDERYVEVPFNDLSMSSEIFLNAAKLGPLFVKLRLILPSAFRWPMIGSRLLRRLSKHFSLLLIPRFLPAIITLMPSTPCSG
jgi:hypothetical protein